VEPEAFLNPVKASPAQKGRATAPVSVDIVVESVADARP
jgi:hypothetical protein